jgi:hypothetical protein
MLKYVHGLGLGLPAGTTEEYAAFKQRAYIWKVVMTCCNSNVLRSSKGLGLGLSAGAREEYAALKQRVRELKLEHRNAVALKEVSKKVGPICSIFSAWGRGRCVRGFYLSLRIWEGKKVQCMCGGRWGVGTGMPERVCPRRVI